MLFDSLLSRALGQKYARQDIDPSAPNRSVSSKVFFAKFPDAVLYRRLESGLIWQMAAPWNWPKLLSPYYGRGDLADQYYDSAIFEGRTFRNLPLRRRRRPPWRSRPEVRSPKPGSPRSSTTR